MNKNVVLVLLGLVIGCGAGAAATPRATAQLYPTAPPMAQPEPTPRWQQICEQAGSVQEASAMAGARGAEGFELVAMYNGVLCFKRPILAGVAQMPAPGTPLDFPGY